MHNQAFSILGMQVYWYGIVIALGVVLAIIVASARERKLGLPSDTTLNLTLLLLPLGLIFARLYYVAFSWDQFKDNLASIINIRQGGMAIYGGIIGGALGVLIYSRAKKIRFATLADLLAPSLVLAQGIGRWGNFFNQEAYGIAVTNPQLQFFPLAVYIEADSAYHFATFFYESSWCILTFIILLLIEHKGLVKRWGDLFLVYVLMYMTERTIVEGLRTDSLYLLSIRVSQIVSVVGVALALGVFAQRTRNKWHIAVVVLLAIGMLLLAAGDLMTLFALAVLAIFSLIYGLYLYKTVQTNR